MKNSHYTFNINYYIDVKLHQRGYELITNNYNEFVDIVPSLSKRTVDFYKEKADKNNGYTHLQMYDFMTLFGNLDGDPSEYYDLNIKINKDYLN